MSKPFTLIGLTGPAASGKDTVADLLVTHCGFIKLAFADPLKAEVADAFGIEPLYLTRRETKEHPMSSLALRKCGSDGFVGRMMIDHREREQNLDLDTPRSPRQIMQWWGTAYRRHQSPAYWTQQTSARVSYLMQQRIATRIIITDCRFANEIDTVRSYGGLVWQIKRAGISVPDGAHLSETSGAGFSPDAIINNSHDIRHLQSVVMGAWLMLETGMSAQEVCNMGLAHTEQGGQS